MGNHMPSENEWIVMEVLWNSMESLTAAEIISRLEGIKDVSPKTIRVLINRLLRKGLVDYTVDRADSRTYHYRAARSRDECLQQKSDHFLRSYFGGDPMGMVATLVKNDSFSEEQLEELMEILQKEKEKGVK